MSDDWHELPLEKVPERANEPRQYYRGSSELLYRQTKAQIDTAEYTKKMVFWMAASVVVLTLASVASFLLDLLTFWRVAGDG